MTDSLGSITWWGFSPSLNFIDELNGNKCDQVNMLLLGAGDIRHILFTIAHSYRQSKLPKLHFYIIETSLELYARQLLFLALALEPQSKMGLQEKCELFLEIYGNVLVRQQTCDYIQKMANLFIKMITDIDYMKEKLDLVDCSQLKFKERDFLEAIFKFWRNPEVDVFDVEKYWDLRMRKIMGARYDSRMNTYDWDYHMRLCDRQGDMINRSDYRTWRHTGVAFEIREGTYDIPNKTLASGLILKHDGERYARRGYWGDMMVGPYIATALQSEAPEMFKKHNGAYIKTSQEVAEYNMTAIFHEILHRTKYSESIKKEAKNSVTTTAMLAEINEDEEEVIDDGGKITNQFDNLELHEDYEPIKLQNVKVTFLPINSLADLAKKGKYKNFFDVIYFSNSLVHLFTPEVTKIFSENAKVIIESAKFILELKKEQYTAYVDKVTEMASAAQCVAVSKIDAEKDIFLKFVYNRNNPTS